MTGHQHSQALEFSGHTTAQTSHCARFSSARVTDTESHSGGGTAPSILDVVTSHCSSAVMAPKFLLSSTKISKPAT